MGSATSTGRVVQQTPRADIPPGQVYPPPVHVQCSPRLVHQPASSQWQTTGNVEVYPPEAFRSADLSAAEMEQLDRGQDTSRDLTLSRIMSAEEFLERMEEVEERIASLTQIGDRQATFVPMKENLGLRGHMQDELLRIEEMLASGDPDLNCLKPFHQSNPRIVSKLMELRAKQKVIKAAEQSQNTEDVDQTLSTVNRNMGVNLDPKIVKTIKRQVSMGHQTDTEEQGTSAGSQDTDIADIDLKVKHNVEEEQVSEDYAEKLLKSRGKPLSQQEVNQLLNDHAVSMQALRRKQAVEKRRQNDLLESKKRERLGKIKEESRPSSQQSRHFAQESKTKEESRPPSRVGSGLQHVKLQNGTVTTVTQMAAPPVAKVTPVVQKTTMVNNKEETMNEKNIKAKDSESDDDADAMAFIAYSRLDLQKDDYSDEFESDSDSGEEGNMMRATLSESLWKEHKKMTSEDFKAALAEFREQQSERNRMKSANNAKYNKDLQDRLAEKHRQKHQNSQDNGSDGMGTQTGGVSTSEAATIYDLDGTTRADKAFVSNLNRQRVRNKMTDEQFAEMMSQHLSQTGIIKKWREDENSKLDQKLKERLGQKGNKGNMENDIDAETEQALAQLAEKFKKEMAEQRKYMSEAELEQMIVDYRKQQLAILSSRKREKLRTDELLAQKLAERNRGRNTENEDDMDDVKEDSEFIHKAAKQKDQLSDEAFADLMSKQLASTEAIRRQREGELNRIDDRLQERLRQKKQVAECAEDEETKQELQKLEENFKNEVAKKRKTMSEDDLQALMAEYRKQQKSLLDKRKSDQSRTDDLLQKKLAEKKKKELGKQQQQEGSKPSTVFKTSDVGSLDDQFFQQLQSMQSSQELDENTFNDLLQNYLKTVDKSKHQKRKLREQREQDKIRDSQNAQQMASSIVQEHQEQTKQIHHIRQRERQGLDEQLQKRLAMKGNKK